MVISQESRTSRIVIALTAAAGLCAAVAAVPSASIGSESGAVKVVKVVAPRAAPAVVPAPVVVPAPATEMRPLARGAAIRVARAFDAEDEDCTLVVTKTPDEGGRTRVKRAVTCAN